jgi:hypothetical protein
MLFKIKGLRGLPAEYGESLKRKLGSHGEVWSPESGEGKEGIKLKAKMGRMKKDEIKLKA